MIYTLDILVLKLNSLFKLDFKSNFIKCDTSYSTYSRASKMGTGRYEMTLFGP